jgi:prephenate dehydratase
MNVGRRLLKSADALNGAATVTTCKEAIMGLDGGYVCSRHQRPEINFEIVAGKVLDDSGNATRFAFVRQSGTELATAADVALRRRGVNESTSLTVLGDCDAGLRAIHQRSYRV